MRAPIRHNPDWGWDTTEIASHPKPDVVERPTAEADLDRNVVGTILGPKGQPLHTVKKAGAVEFGYRRP